MVNKTLLKLPFYQSNTDWSPRKYNIFLVDSIIQFIKKPDKELIRIAKDHLSNGNYEAFNRLNSINNFEEDINYNEFKDEQYFIEKIENEIQTLRSEIERGSAYGYINENERFQYISFIEEIKNTSRDENEGINYPLRHYQIINTKSQVEIEKNVLKEKYKKLIPSDSKYKDTLLKYLDKDNLLVFNENLVRIKNNTFIISEKNDDKLVDFYQSFLKENISRSQNKIIEAIKKRTKYLGFDFSSLSKLQAEEVSDLYKKWISLKNRNKIGSIENSSIEAILEGIGFSPLDLEKPVPDKKDIYYLNFTSDPIHGRDKTPIPRFGSVANGNYRLILITKSYIEEEILDIIKELSNPDNNRAVIIFYFDWLNQDKRLEISKISKKRRQSFLLLDEAMLLYLLGLNESKFPVFIKLAAPITFAEPYQTASSNLPEEMFYGRSPQKEKLKNIIGDYSSLIYGGRQLGKTVLQREVERVFHNPERNNFAIYIDLRDSGIGSWNPIDKIKDVLYDHLKIIPKLFPDNYRANSSYDTILKYIKKWLDLNLEARILLFLDESDNFLRQDSQKNWPYLLPLKGLMEKTEKRFKFILSGLHDVRRTIKIPNNPLAHLGNPICVGSMLEDEEALEAQKLVTLPLQTLGFEFESEDLVFTILSHCNWYPSLIQIFCSSLLNIMNNKRNVKQFPVLIKEDDISFAYKKSHKQIKEKFSLTLGLDERYDLLANIIAFQTLNNPDYQVNGLSIYEITEKAIYYWSSGFDNTNTKTVINNLLEEMTDLGILRMVSYGHFAIRIPNLISLIGTKKEIEENLFKDRSLALEFNRETSRINYKKQNKDIRSPFPAIYYDEIIDQNNKTIIIRGSKVGGIDYIQEFLTARKEDIRLIIPENISINDDSFWIKIDKKRSRQKKDENFKDIVFFRNVNKFSVKDIIKINDKIQNKKSLSALLIFEPQKIWDFLFNKEKAFDRLESKNIKIIDIPKWKKEVAKDWFKDFCPGADLEIVEDRIGYWHHSLSNFHLEVVEHPELWKEKLEELSKKEIKKETLYSDYAIINDRVKNIMSELIEYDGSIDKMEFTQEYGTDVFDYINSTNLINNNFQVDPIIKKIVLNG